MGNSSPLRFTVVDKQTATTLLEQANRIDSYIDECDDDRSNYLARQNYSYAPNKVTNIQHYTDIFNGYIPKIPKQLHSAGDVTIVVLMPTADGGMPHTRPPNIICYPGHPNESLSTLTHELCHVHQRKFPTMWNHIFEGLGWKKWDGDLPEMLDSHRRYNPDTVDSPLWIYGNWIPVPIFNDIRSPLLTEADIWFYHVNGYHVKTIPSELEVEFLPKSAYEHPREMTAYIISEPHKYYGTAVYKKLKQYIDI